MDSETCNAVKSPPTPEINLLEGSEWADDEERRDKIMPDEEEEYFSYSKESRTNRFTKNSSFPVYVYAYKVKLTKISNSQYFF